MKKSEVKNNTYHYEVSSKTIVDIIGITVFMWENHKFETIFTSDDVLNIQYAIGKLFGSRERELYMELNDYFGPRRTNRTHSTPNYVPEQSKF